MQQTTSDITTQESHIISQTIHIGDICMYDVGKRIEVKGWVKRIREQSKKLTFVELYDGTTLRRLPCVITGRLPERVDFMASVRIVGHLTKHPKADSDPRYQKTVELLCELSESGEDEFEIICGCDPESYPLAKTELTTQFLRQHPVWRMRTDLFTAAMRVRSELSYAIHWYFRKFGVQYMHTPIITKSDCEGAGEAFGVQTPKDFFPGSRAYLTVSGQLQGEIAAAALGAVYTFGPTFRAEASGTNRHAAEFWMVEPEISFLQLPGLIECAQDLLRHCVSHVLAKCQTELQILQKHTGGLIEKLQKFASTDFIVLTYSDVIDQLQPFSDRFDVTPEWGIDLGSEHERFLVEHIHKQTVVVTDYPKEIKAFYMHENDDGRTVAAMDVLVPGIGEMIGGSQREIRYDVLQAKMAALGLDYQWYLDLRRFGSVPHSGYGLGFDRLVMYVTGMTHIKDVAPFPVTYRSLTL